MSTPPVTPLPMEDEVYASYTNLLEILNAQCESATGAATVPLNDAAQALSDLLTVDNELAFEASTASFTALTPQMCKANEAIRKLQAQLANIATGIADVGKIEAGINKVLGLAAKFL